MKRQGRKYIKTSLDLTQKLVEISQMHLTRTHRHTPKRTNKHSQITHIHYSQSTYTLKTHAYTNLEPPARRPASRFVFGVNILSKHEKFVTK